MSAAKTCGKWEDSFHAKFYYSNLKFSKSMLNIQRPSTILNEFYFLAHNSLSFKSGIFTFPYIHTLWWSLVILNAAFVIKKIHLGSLND